MAEQTENTLILSVFGAVFLQDVEQLLTAMGYTSQTGDDWLKGFCADKVVERIKNACNVANVPDGLYYTAVALIVAEFLTLKIGTGATAGLTNLNFEPVLKQLQEGDTNMVFAVDVNSSDSAQMLGLLNLLKSTAEAQFVTYRRIRW